MHFFFCLPNISLDEDLRKTYFLNFRNSQSFCKNRLLLSLSYLYIWTIPVLTQPTKMINKGQISAKQCQSFLSREQPNVNMEVIKNTLKIETEACKQIASSQHNEGEIFSSFFSDILSSWHFPAVPIQNTTFRVCVDQYPSNYFKEQLWILLLTRQSILRWILSIVSSILGKTIPWLFLLSTMGLICKAHILHLILHLTAESISLATITNTLAAKG